MSQVQILPSVAAFLQRTHGHFIAGKMQESMGKVQIDVINPATEQVISKISLGNQVDVDSAVIHAHQAFKTTWAATTPYERGQRLHQLADLLEQHGEELAQLESLSTGKLINLARHLEVQQSVVFMRYFAGWATKIMGQTMQPSIPSMQGEQYTAFTMRQPVGVVAGIVPWNFALMIGVWKIASALCTGCSIVLKPSEFASLSLLKLAELSVEAGIPEGVINVVTGDGSTGQHLIESSLVKKVSFTGSVPTGIAIGKLAMSSNLTRVSLELGGKNALAIFEDADIDTILPTLLQATFVHQGQICAAPEKLFVHQSRYEELVSKLSAALQGMAMGDAMDEDSMFGPLSNLPHFNKVKTYLVRAKAKHHILYGGNVLDRVGYYVEPTLIGVRDLQDPLLNEECFGPVVCVLPFEDENALIEHMNHPESGLTASLWTNDLSRTLRLIPKLEVGTVWVNMHTFLDPAVPFGGTQASGLGREFGGAFIEDYTEVKSVMIRY